MENRGISSGAAMELILTEFQDGILTIRFNRPEKKNALNLAMYSALTLALEQADRDTAIRVIMLAGSEGCFTSGNDLGDFLSQPLTGESNPILQFIRAISLTRRPIVAAVQGDAVGIGVTMLLHCDLVYAAESALFRMPFVSLGLCPEAGSALLLPRMMGHQKAAGLLLLGETFTAAQACAYGIVTAVFPDGELPDRARGKALQLAAQPPAAVRLAKALLKADHAESLQEVIVEEGRQFLARLKSPEASEALQAFTERRTPDFSRFE
jgi:enoyl-CoA hydratase/carnithine racemase